MAARNFASVKLKADLVDDARKEAELFNRSLGGQIEHWARVGRALEGAPQFSTERVRATLMGRLKMEELSAAERELEEAARYLEGVEARYASSGDGFGGFFSRLFGGGGGR